MLYLLVIILCYEVLRVLLQGRERVAEGVQHGVHELVEEAGRGAQDLATFHMGI